MTKTRLRAVRVASAALLVLLAACSSSTKKSTATTTTAASTASTASTTTEAPSTTAAVPTTSVVPEPQWPDSLSTPAGKSVADWLHQVRHVHDGAAPLLASLDKAAAAGGAPSAGDDQHLAGLETDFMSLIKGIDPTLNPVVRRAAGDVLFALGAEVSPALFAPGLDLNDWATNWTKTIADGRSRLAPAVSALLLAVNLHPEIGTYDPSSIDAAAFTGGLTIVTIRGFGHLNFTAQPQWSVSWLGGLPVGTAAAPAAGGNDCLSVVGKTPKAAWKGTAKKAAGGCALVWYTTADPTTKAKVVTAYKAKPTTANPDGGELVAVRYEHGAWVPYGSVE